MITLAIVGAALLLATTVAVILSKSRRRLLRQIGRDRSRRRAQLRSHISERAYARDARKRYQEHFQDSPVPVLFTTPEGQIVAANRAVLDLLGFPTEDDLKR